MGKEVLTLHDVEIEKYKFHRYEDPNFLNDVNADNIFISKNISASGKKL